MIPLNTLDFYAIVDNAEQNCIVSARDLRNIKNVMVSTRFFTFADNSTLRITCTVDRTDNLFCAYDLSILSDNAMIDIYTDGSTNLVA